MKKILYSFLLMAAGLFAASCEQAHIEEIFNPAAVNVQTLGVIPGAVLDSEGAALTTTFNAVDFKIPVASTYTLYASASSDMSDRKKVSASIKLDENRETGTITLLQKDLNSLVYNLGGEADVPFTIYFQLAAAIVNDKSAAIAVTEQLSNIVSAEFTPYSTVIRDVDLYDHVWAIGASSMMGGWSHDKVFQFLYDYGKRT